METIHTTCKDFDTLKKIYSLTLKDDPKFHAFWEPYLIIRVSVPECKEVIIDFLEKRKYKYRVYEYPSPPVETTIEPSFEDWGNHREDGIVLKYLDHFIQMFHLHSVAAIEMDEQDHMTYRERVIHTMYNPKMYFGKSEANELLSLANERLESEKQLKCIL